jgi:hypothetical protein
LKCEIQRLCFGAGDGDFLILRAIQLLPSVYGVLYWRQNGKPEGTFGISRGKMASLHTTK